MTEDVKELANQEGQDLNSATLQMVVQGSAFADLLAANGRDKKLVADITMLAALQAAMFFIRRYQVPEEMAKKMVQASVATANDDTWFTGLEGARLEVLKKLKTKKGITK